MSMPPYGPSGHRPPPPWVQQPVRTQRPRRKAWAWAVFLTWLVVGSGVVVVKHFVGSSNPTASPTRSASYWFGYDDGRMEAYISGGQGTAEKQRGAWGAMQYASGPPFENFDWAQSHQGCLDGYASWPGAAEPHPTYTGS